MTGRPLTAGEEIKKKKMEIDTNGQWFERKDARDIMSVRCSASWLPAALQTNECFGCFGKL